MAELKPVVAIAPQGVHVAAMIKLTKAADETTAAKQASDTFPNPSGRTIIVLQGGAADANVYLIPQGKPGGLTLQPYQIAVKKGEFVIDGPFDPTVYNSASNAVGISTAAADIGILLITIP